jgi:hypothetical protein
MQRITLRCAVARKNPQYYGKTQRRKTNAEDPSFNDFFNILTTHVRLMFSQTRS